MFREWCARECLGDSNKQDLEFISNPLHHAFLYYIDCPQISKKMCLFWNELMINYQTSLTDILKIQESFKILISQLL